jgi:transcriptional regulator with XRE-family HTH domain
MSDTPTPNEAFKIFRSYLGFSQMKLAAEMGVTPTSISRWETASVELAEHSTPLLHLKALVEKKLAAEIHKCFTDIKPDLTIGEFEGLFGIPSASFRRARDGKLYMGMIQIREHHDHLIEFSIDDQCWLAVGEDGIGKKLTKEFLKSLRHQTRPTRYQQRSRAGRPSRTSKG